MSNRRLLIAFAHPDDESFGLGGLISKYVAEGVDVYLICATNGDVGTISPELLNGYQSHAELRLAELDCAAQKLGFKQVFTFGYRDSGMMGSEHNQAPDCLWHNYQTQPESVERRVVEVMRQVKPQVVITFNKYGGYGHPDHIAIQQATARAFELAGQADYSTEGLAPYQPQKLYYSGIPTLMLRLGIFIARLRRQNPRRMGRNKDIDLVKILDYIEPTHAKVDITGYLDAWAAANACHVSQGGGGSGMIPAWLRRLVGVKQGFTRVHPAPPVDRVDENDLFARATLDEAVNV